MWWKLKYKFSRYVQNLEHSGMIKRIVINMKKAEETAWKNIPSCCFEACVESMPRRVKAVIDAKGWFTKY